MGLSSYVLVGQPVAKKQSQREHLPISFMLSLCPVKELCREGVAKFRFSNIWVATNKLQIEI